jgi:hypothetical protein
MNNTKTNVNKSINNIEGEGNESVEKKITKFIEKNNLSASEL